MTRGEGSGRFRAEQWLGMAPEANRPTDCMPLIDGVNTGPLTKWDWDKMPLSQLAVECGGDARLSRQHRWGQGGSSRGAEA